MGSPDSIHACRKRQRQGTEPPAQVHIYVNRLKGLEELYLWTWQRVKVKEGGVQFVSSGMTIFILHNLCTRNPALNFRILRDMLMHCDEIIHVKLWLGNKCMDGAY